MKQYNRVDGMLIRKAQCGDKEAFGMLTGNHYNHVYKFALGITGDEQRAEDIAQETFLNAYSNITGYEGIAKFSTWLCKIAHNVAVSEGRRKRANVSLDSVIDQVVNSKSMSPEDQATDNERKLGVRAAIDSLPPKYKAVMWHFYVEGESQTVIAERYKTNINTIRTRLHRGRELVGPKIRIVA